MGHLLCASLALDTCQGQKPSPCLQGLPSFGEREPSRPTSPAPAGCRRVPAAARWRSAPAHWMWARVALPPWDLGGGRSGRGRGRHRRLCDFGFDLPGDVLIPPYNSLEQIGKWLLRYLRRHGDHRARIGGARVWKNTAFVGDSCHSRRGDRAVGLGSAAPAPERHREALG